MGDRLSLSKARAMRDEDSRMWTAEELLLDLLEQIRRGQINPKQIAVHWFEHTENKDSLGKHDFIIAQCSLPEHVLLLEIGKQSMLDALRS